MVTKAVKVVRNKVTFNVIIGKSVGSFENAGHCKMFNRSVFINNLKKTN